MTLRLCGSASKRSARDQSVSADSRRRTGRADRSQRCAARRGLRRRCGRKRRGVHRPPGAGGRSTSIVLDVWLPGLDGLATLGRLRQMKIESQVVMISGHGNIESAVKAIKMGAFDFVEKPLSLEKTVLVVRNALRQRRLEAENRALRARVDRAGRMVGESAIDPPVARAGGDGRADQRPRADLRRERHGQGSWWPGRCTR